MNQSIRKVCVAGAGFMGQVIALRCACHGGYPVVVYDVSPESIAKAPTLQRHLGETMVAMKKLEREQLERGMALIRYTTDAREAAEGADLLSESVPEVLATKRLVHGMFEKLLPASAIITTNTSYLLATDIEVAIEARERFAAFHFHGLGASLVDVVAGSRTSAATLDALTSFALSIGEHPMLLRKEHRGYLYNHMLGSLLGSALQLVIDGYADPKAVDKAYMLASGLAYGPFGIMDAVGLDVIASALPIGLEQRTKPDAAELAAFLQPYLAAGKLGQKSGEGFYTYPAAEFLGPEFLKP